MSDEKCCAGCMVFYGGEIKHHKDCVFYPDSLTELYSKEIESIRSQLEQKNKRITELEDVVREEIRVTDYVKKEDLDKTKDLLRKAVKELMCADSELRKHATWWDEEDNIFYANEAYKGAQNIHKFLTDNKKEIGENKGDKMKYKYEAFKDWKDLFTWCSESKPIKFNDCDVSKPSEDGSYYFTFQADLSSYKKAIPIREEEYSFDISFYKDERGIIFPRPTGYPVYDFWKLIKTEKFTTMLEVEE